MQKNTTLSKFHVINSKKLPLEGVYRVKDRLPKMPAGHSVLHKVRPYSRQNDS